MGYLGGLEALRAHLRGLFAEAPPAKQKLVAQLSMAERLLSDYEMTVQKNATGDRGYHQGQRGSA